MYDKVFRSQLTECDLSSVSCGPLSQQYQIGKSMGESLAYSTYGDINTISMISGEHISVCIGDG